MILCLHVLRAYTEGIPLNGIKAYCHANMNVASVYGSIVSWQLMFQSVHPS